MKKNGLGAALLAAFALQFSPARAQSVTLLSETRGVSIYGVAGNGSGQSYSQSQFSPGSFTPFNAAINGTANWTDPSPPYNTPPAANYHAHSLASQTSSITNDDFADAGTLFGEGYVPSQGPASGGVSNAGTASTFEVSFSIASAAPYTLTFFNSYHHADGSQDPGDQIAMFPQLYLGQSNILGAPAYNGSGWSYTGTLAPGSYTLAYNPSSATVSDPLGDSLQLNYSLDFKVTPVPEPSGYLAFGLLVLCAVEPVSRAVRKTKNSRRLK